MATLVDELIPVVDEVRQLATDFGIRPYQVFLVYRSWESGTIGDGLYHDLETEIVPRPRLSGWQGNERKTRSGGVLGVGDARCVAISRTFTKEQLVGVDSFPFTVTTGEGESEVTTEYQEFFWRVYDETNGKSYRFRPQNEPRWRASAWEVTLKPEGKLTTDG